MSLKEKIVGFDLKLKGKLELFFFGFISLYLVFDQIVRGINSYSWVGGFREFSIIFLGILPVLLLIGVLALQFLKRSKWPVYIVLLTYLITSRSILFSWLISSFRNTSFLNVVNLFLGAIVFTYVVLQVITIFTRGKMKKQDVHDSKYLFVFMIVVVSIFYLLYGFSTPLFFMLIAILLYMKKEYFLTYSLIGYYSFFRLFFWIQRVLMPGTLTYDFNSVLTYFVPMIVLAAVVLLFIKDGQMIIFGDIKNDLNSMVSYAKDNIKKMKKEEAKKEAAQKKEEQPKKEKVETVEEKVVEEVKEETHEEVKEETKEEVHEEVQVEPSEEAKKEEN